MVNLQAVLEEKGLTQTWLANKVGATQNVISKIKLGKYTPPPRLAVKIAAALKTTTDVLNGTGEYSNNKTPGVDSDHFALTPGIERKILRGNLRSEFMEYAFNKLFLENN